MFGFLARSEIGVRMMQLNLDKEQPRPDTETENSAGNRGEVKLGAWSVVVGKVQCLEGTSRIDRNEGEMVGVRRNPPKSTSLLLQA